MLEKATADHLLLAILLLIAAAGSACSAAGQARPDWLEPLEVSRIGVDDTGHVWTLSAGGGRIEVHSRTGEVLQRVTDPAFSDGPVDVDFRWGVVYLSNGGHEVRVKGLDGREVGTLTLTGPAGSVAWIDESTVAVGPELSNHTVELWSIATGSMVRAMGAEKPVLPGPGAQLARGVDIAYDSSSQTIYTVAGFTGRYRAFSLTGEMLREEHVEDPQRKTIEDWLAEVDRSARQSGQEERPVFWSLALSLDGWGSPWVMQECADEKSATLVHIRDDKGADSVKVDVPCCWSSLAMIGDWMVLYADPRYAGSTCKSLRRM